MTPAQRWYRRAEWEFARLKAGLDCGPCWLLTVTRQRAPEAGWGQDLNLDTAIRGDVLTPLTRRMRRRWRGVETWSVLEWGKKNEGAHLHVVVRGTVGLTTEWVNEVIQAKRKPYEAHVEPIEDASVTEDVQVWGDIVTYLTKQLRDRDILEGWPPYTHVVSATSGWLPRDDDTEEVAA